MTCTPGTHEATAPAGLNKGRLALRMGAVALEKLGERESDVELDWVLGHGALLG